VKQIYLIVVYLVTSLFSCNTIKINEIPPQFVYTIKEHGDSIFYSTNDGGIFRFHLDNTDSIIKIGYKKYHPIRSLLFSSEGVLFASSYRSGLYKVINDSLISYSSWYIPTWSMKHGPDGKIWLAAKSGVYKQCGDTFRTVTDLKEAFDLDFFNGDLVVAHFKGISFYDLETGKCKRTICKDTIFWMLTAIDSQLICGGVESCIIMSTNNRKSVTIGPRNNIPWACTIDTTQSILLGTEKGLFRIMKSDTKAHCIGYKNRCIKSVLVDSKGRLWVGKYFKDKK
jgi:hypothetical protein